MFFTVVVVVASIAASVARGGRIGRIADAELAAPGLLFVGLVLQLGVDAGAATGIVGGALGPVLLGASHVLVLWFIARNRHVPGMSLVFVGFLLNAIVMAVNGAMPVHPEAITAIGLDGAEVPPGKHELMTSSTLLPWLADVIPLPPIRTIISVGDLVLAAGMIPLVHQLMSEQRLWRRPAPLVSARRGVPRRA